jgi:hypothetical protein
MKSLRYVLLLAVTMLTVEASAKLEITNNIYMFGFSASFKDSVIYATDIQNPQGLWIDTKKDYLINLDEYSHQLKVYLTEKLQQQNRVCMVFFYTKKKKAEKAYLKLMKKYKTGYEVRYVNENDFKFEPIDSDPEEEE